MLGFAQKTRARPIIGSSKNLVLAFTLTLLIESVDKAYGGWTDMFSHDTESAHYAQSSADSWLGSSSLGIKVKGCAWSYVNNNDKDENDYNCMENESEDGTTYWYMMANCRRANVVYDVYASSSGSASCSSSNFQESFVTNTGLSSFLDTINGDENSPFGNAGDDGYDEFPMCEYDDSGYYYSVGCTDSGGFSIDKFSDEYCTTRIGQVKTLSSLNTIINKMSCFDATNIAEDLIGASNTCAGTDFSACTTSTRTAYMGTKGNTLSNVVTAKSGILNNMTWENKLKYASGGLLLLSSLVMFMGILFTNRRKRRAMMHRKFRQRHGKDARSRRSRRSSSRRRTKDETKSRRSSKSRSKSKSRRSGSKAPREKTIDTGDGGVGYFA